MYSNAVLATVIDIAVKNGTKGEQTVYDLSISPRPAIAEGQAPALRIVLLAAVSCRTSKSLMNEQFITVINMW